MQLDHPSEDVANVAAQKRSFELACSKFESLKGVMDQSVDAVFGRSLELRSIADKVILSLGWAIVEDFREIAALAELGLGVGAMKLLRGQYERVVTGSYLSLHPDVSQDFLDYWHVHHHKLREHAKPILDLHELVPSEKA